MALQTRSRRWVIGSFAAVAAGVVGTLALTSDPSHAQEGKGPDALKGKAAPAIALSTLDGKEVKLADAKGKVVLVDFWATWCGPCVVSLPHINKLSEDAKLKERGLEVWAVNLREQPEKVKTFMTSRKLSLTVPMDVAGKTAESYQVQGIPTTVVVGRDGKVADVFVGAGPDTAKQLDAAVEKALKEKAPK